MAKKCISLEKKEKELIWFAVKNRQNFLRKKGDKEDIPAIKDYEKILKKMK